MAIQKSRDSSRKPDFHPETWMIDWADYIGDKKLEDINIPGAHDAATSNITWQSIIAHNEDLPEALNHLRYAGVGFALNNVIAKWARAQDHSIRALLDCGVRYLDLRIAPKTKETNKVVELQSFVKNKLSGLFGQLKTNFEKKVKDIPDYYSVHGLYGESLKDILANIRAFMDQNPDEFVILDFQKITGGINNHLYALVIEALGPDCIGTIDDLSQTLNQLWTGSKRLFLFAKNDSPDYPFLLSRNDFLESHWPNASTDKEFNDKMKPYFDHFKKTKLTAIQAQLTPDNNSIIESFKPLSKAPSSLKKMWKNWQGAVLSKLESWYDLTRGAIIQADFVDAHFAQKVVELNAN